MRSLRLIWIGPALLRLATFVGNVPVNFQLSAKGWTSLNYSSLVKASLVLILLLLAPAVTLRAFAQDKDQDKEKTFGDSFTPLVYQVENTGAHYRTPNFPTFAQLPIIRPLPDPFQFSDGWRDPSFQNWERRRNEIKAAIEKYEIGPKPDCSDCTITSTYTPPAAGSNTGSLAVVVTRNGKSLTLNERVYIPPGMGSGPFPAVIAMSLAFPPFFVPPVPNYGSLPSSVFASLPVATVDFFHNDVTTYSFFGVVDHSTDPFYQLYPELCAGTCSGNVSTSGQYAAWSWGVSRLIDGMEIATHQAVNPLPIDMKHLAVTGCSYAGKMALFAGAFDERVALTIAQENGGGGAPAWRVSHEIEAQGTVEDIDDTDYNWFAGQMKQFAGDNVYKLPVDHHELMAMVAPRALLETGNTEFYWLSNGSNYISARATQRIYNTLGIGDRFGFYIDGNHQHCATLPAEAAPIQAFVNRFMLGQSADTDVAVYPNPADTTDYGYPIVVSGGGYAYYFPTIDYRRWTDWWGSNKPIFPNDWNTGGTVLASLKGDLEVNSGDTVEGGYELTLGGKHPAATVSLVSGANITTDISCRDGSSYTLTIPLPVQSYSFAAGDNSWYPTHDPLSPLVNQGSATAVPPSGSPACIGGRTTHAYFSATGLSENGDGNPGGPGFLTTDITDPLSLRFHCSDSTNGAGGHWSPAVTIDWAPLSSADSTNQNPVQQ
ncbi:MAG TPA: hypothetical protein VHT28_04925 [Silvibacterium sp.]|jgi:hypothetical protein|nr:hypothetical protein [Silvibacterium sp.]